MTLHIVAVDGGDVALANIVAEYFTEATYHNEFSDKVIPTVRNEDVLIVVDLGSKHSQSDIWKEAGSPKGIIRISELEEAGSGNFITMEAPKEGEDVHQFLLALYEASEGFSVYTGVEKRR